MTSNTPSPRSSPSSVVAQLVLLDEQLPVDPQVLRVRAQEALDESGAGQHLPLLVLDRAQVLRTDLRRRLDLGDVDPRAHPRLLQRGADVGHNRREGYSLVCGAR